MASNALYFCFKAFCTCKIWFCVDMREYMYNVTGVSLHCMPLDHKLKVSTKHLRIVQSFKSKCKLAQVFKIAVQDLKSES